MTPRNPPLAGNPRAGGRSIEDTAAAGKSDEHLAPGPVVPYPADSDSIAQRDARANAYLADKACTQATRAASVARVFFVASAAALVAALAVSCRTAQPPSTSPERGTTDKKGALK
jgi:hypothetical protein